jgi:hypothetical protein
LALHKESLALYRDLGHRVGMIGCLDDLGHVAASLHEGARAGRLLGATEAARSVIGVEPTPVQLAARQQTIATLRAEMGEQACVRALAEGRAMTLEQAVAYALDESVAESVSAS